MSSRLTAAGVLPEGEHDLSWMQMVEEFGSNPRRVVLLSGLRDACAALAVAGCRTLWLDGSFVTAEPNPGDYDACWSPEGVDPSALDPVLLDWSKPGRMRMRAKYLGDLFIAGVEASSSRPFVEFFQRDRDDNPKGIVVLDPRSVP